MDRHPHESIRGFVREIFRSLETPDDIASAIASSLVGADLRGHEAQGVLRVPWIVDKIRNGEIDPASRPSVNRVTDVATHLKGKSAIGQYVGRRAVDLVVDMACENGIGVVTIRHANDLGRVGEWAERAAGADVVFECHVSARGHPSVAPNGCGDRLLSTNPVTIGVPTFDALEFPIVLDMATSQAAYGQIEQYEQAGKELPPEWTTTKSGKPVVDPTEFLKGEGAILPLGGRATGYKGFGLGIVNELLAGILSDGFVAGQSDRPRSGNDAVFIAIDATRFTTQQGVEERITTCVEYLRSAECSSEVEVGMSSVGPEGHLRLPGEGSYRTLKTRQEAGIPLPEETISSLRTLSEEIGCTESEPDSFR